MQYCQYDKIHYLSKHHQARHIIEHTDMLYIYKTNPLTRAPSAQAPRLILGVYSTSPSHYTDLVVT